MSYTWWDYWGLGAFGFEAVHLLALLIILALIGTLVRGLPGGRKWSANGKALKRKPEAQPK